MSALTFLLAFFYLATGGSSGRVGSQRLVAEVGTKLVALIRGLKAEHS